MVSNAPAQLLPDNTPSSFTNFLPEQQFKRSKRGCNFGNILPVNVAKCHRRKIYVFWQKALKLVGIVLSGTRSFFPLWILLKPWTLSFNKGKITTKAGVTVKTSHRTQTIDNYLAHERSGPAFFSADERHLFGSNDGNEFGVMLRKKGPHKPKLAYDLARIYSLMMYKDLIEYKIIGDTKSPLLRCFPFISKLQAGDNKITGRIWTIRHFVSYNLDCCSKSLFIFITLTWETRAVKKNLLYLSLSLLLFW